jgi:lipid A ethanolaminephosphotransferase
MKPFVNVSLLTRRKIAAHLYATQGLIVLLGLWVLTAGNTVLWSAVTPLLPWPALLGFAGIWLCLWVALFQLLAWPWLLKPLLFVAVLCSAGATHFMQTYGVVIDPSMVQNALATDTREVRDLLSWGMVWTLVWIGGPAFVLLWRSPPTGRISFKSLFKRLLWCASALVLALVLLWLIFGDMAALMRNDKSIRYKITPFNVFYGVGQALAPRASLRPVVLQPVGDDVQTLPARTPAPLLVLVVGETARAANFGLGGYERDTTPRLRAWHGQGQMVYWHNAQSCGTNTEVSVPCMFSPLTREEGGDKKAQHENLLDVLHKAGLGVFWIDNQSGCKGVCDRVPNLHMRGQGDPRLCQGGECFDEAMVQQLDATLASIAPERRQRGVVLVLHQMGSHGPAYHKRTPSDEKPFLPECENNTLTQCSPEALRNAYDNTVAYTDKVLHQTLLWLQAQERSNAYAGAMVYASDHGESLGEKGVYLHGAPRFMAPTEQTHIPMLAWYSKRFAQISGVSVDCLKKQAQQDISHDHLFHSVLGMMGVKTQAHRPELDWNQGCRP